MQPIDNTNNRFNRWGGRPAAGKAEVRIRRTRSSNFPPGLFAESCKLESKQNFRGFYPYRLSASPPGSGNWENNG